MYRFLLIFLLGAFSQFTFAQNGIVKDAESCMSSPYKYGGTSKSGFDCSGLVFTVFKQNGFSISRSSQAQFDQSKKVKLKKLKPGDLVFFGKSKKKISHVGIVLSNKKDGLFIIHSSSSKGVIKTDILSDPYWSKRIISGGRMG